jgi:autotransporter-associated beta strand protein
MTFNSPGYVIKDGWIKSGANGLKITANEDVTIGSTLSGSNEILIKDGPGTLTVNGTNFINTVRIDEGIYRVEGTSSLFFSDVFLANNSTAGVTLASTYQSTSIGGLSGGGLAGGFVQPDDRAATTTLTIFGSESFDGVIRDSGAGKLAISVIGTQVLTNANTYSGNTEISRQLTLANAGSILNSASVRTLGLGVLSLDNSAATANRLSDTGEVLLSGGELQLLGHQNLAVEEVVGTLSIQRPSNIRVQSAGAETLLTFTSFTREKNATLNILGDGVKLSGVTVGTSGILSPAITRGNDWATLGPDQRVSVYSAYTSDINSGGTFDNVKITVPSTLLADSTSKSTLNLQNGGTSTQILNLNSKTLQLSGGGILTSGTASSIIAAGQITSTAQELIVTTRNNLTIEAAITGIGASLTKSGAGSLTLTNTNTYTGNTSIVQGTLVVLRDANLGMGTSLNFEGGTLRAAASFSSAKGITGSGSVNTGGYDVLFSGTTSGSITKYGAGRLTLSDFEGTYASVGEGTLSLPSVDAANVSLDGGKLEVNGRISSLSINRASTIDIAPLTISTLEVESIGPPSGSTGISTFVFDLKSTLSDLLFLEDPWLGSPSGSQGFFISFRNLGDVSIGIDYKIMEFGRPAYFPIPLGMSPESLALGWVGLFTQTEDGVTIRFSSVGAPVPEPSPLLLLLLGAPIVWFLRKRRAVG